MIVGLIFLVREIGSIWLRRKNGNGGDYRSLDDRLTKIEKNDLHDFDELRKEVMTLKTDFYVFKQKVEDKIFNTNP